jgi:tRNA pseudouridine55 synthase
MFGFLNIRKLPGPTSHDVVAHIRRLLGQGQARRDRPKVGHAGTLDPFAQGVLVLCLGPATRLARFIQAQPKRYNAEITLGATSTTDDPEGEISPTGCSSPPSPQALAEVLSKFTGRILQVPPTHCAVHLDGRRAYDLARSGQTVSLPGREVVVYELNILSYTYPLLNIDVHCGCGTYIRSLARDIGQALGLGGYCSKLTRTAVGKFDLGSARTLDELDIPRDIIKPQEAIDLPGISVSEQDAAALRQGRTITIEHDADLAAVSGPESQVLLIDRADRLVALAKPGLSLETSRVLPLKPVKVFPPTSCRLSAFGTQGG